MAHTLTTKTGPYQAFGLEYDEGWAVFECDDGVLRIERLDSPQDARPTNPFEPMFESDAAALEYVQRRANEGSQYHREALALCKLLPSQAVKPTDGEIYAVWENIYTALRDVMRSAPTDVVRWFAEHSEGNDAVAEAARDHLEMTGD